MKLSAKNQIFIEETLSIKAKTAMRKSALLSIFVLLIGYWAYIPTFWFPEFASVAYLEFPWVIHGVCILLQVVLLLMYNNWGKWLVLMAYFALFFATPVMRDTANWLTIKVNQEKPIEEFNSPYPGYKLVLPDGSKPLSDVDAMFIYEDYGWTFEALVFKKDHGLHVDSFTGGCFTSDYSVGKIYNKDWYKYYMY